MRCAFPAALALCLLMVSLAPAQENETWKLMLQKNREEIDYQAAYVDGAVKALAPLLSHTRQDIAALRKKHDDLMALVRVTGANPTELRAVQAGFEALRDRLDELAKPFRQAEADFKRFQERLAELEPEFSRQVAEGPEPELAKGLAEAMARVKTIKSQMGRVKAVLGQGLATAKDMEALLARSDKSVSERIPRAWRDYYLSPGRGLISFQAWQEAVQRLGDLPKLVGVYLSLFDNESAKLTEVLARFLALSGLVVAGAWIGLSRLRPRLPWLAPVSRPLGVVVWVTLGLCVQWVTSGQAFLLVRAESNALSEILLARGMLCLAWYLRRLTPGQAPAGKNPAGLAWCLFALAVFLQIPWLPSALRAAIWVLALLAAGAWIRRNRGRMGSDVTAALARTGVWLLPLLAVPALIGWLNLTLLAAMAWFLALVFLQAGLATRALLHAFLDRPRSEGLEASLLTAAQGLVVPGCVIVMSGSALLWLSMFLGGVGVFASVVEYDIGLGPLSIDLKRLAVILTGYSLTQAVTRLARRRIETLPANRPDLEKGLVNLLETVADYVLWGLYAIMSLYCVGVDFTSLAVVAGGLSVGVGFGMQNIINNFVSGLILLFGRSIQAGDTLQIGETWGVVKRVNIRNTVVQTFDNATLFVPNSDLIAQKIINWSHRDRRVRRAVDVGVLQGADVALVRDLLLKAASEQPHVLPEPKPSVVFAAFGETSLEFKLLMWVDDVDNAAKACSSARVTIERLFRAHGIELPGPKQAPPGGGIPA